MTFGGGWAQAGVARPAFVDLMSDLRREVAATETSRIDGAFRQARFENYNVYSVPFRMAEIFDVLRAYAGLTDLQGLRVLDCGCGNGGTSLYLGTEAQAGAVVGVDINADSLGVASRVAERNELQHVRFVQGDLGRLPVATGRRDIALLYDCLVYRAIDLKTALWEQQRVLRPGGRVVVKVANRWSPLMLALSARGIRSLTGPVLKRLAASGDRVLLSDSMEVPSAGDMKRLLKECKFTDVRVYDRFRRSDHGWYRYFAPDVIVAATKPG